LRKRLPGVPDSRSRRVLVSLREAERVASEGRGPGTVWRAIERSTR
jgi:hypothetical protein